MDGPHLTIDVPEFDVVAGALQLTVLLHGHGMGLILASDYQSILRPYMAFLGVGYCGMASTILPNWAASFMRSWAAPASASGKTLSTTGRALPSPNRSSIAANSPGRPIVEPM